MWQLNQSFPIKCPELTVIFVFAHLYPGDRLLGLHHPGGLGGLALAHQLGAAQVARPEQHALDQNFGVGNRTWNENALMKKRREISS